MARIANIPVAPDVSSPAALALWARQVAERINLLLGQLDSLPVYASDSAAGTGKVASGGLYKTSDGSGGFYLKVKA